jgi:hypothetical protein
VNQKSPTIKKRGIKTDSKNNIEEKKVEEKKNSKEEMKNK